MPQDTSHSDCIERVALDLAKTIYNNSETGQKSTTHDRDYWIRLYHQCLQVVRHGKPEEILKKS